MRAQVELRRRILSGEFPGGTRLLEVAMAEELEISRTPVREAMSRLAEEGLLERARGGGFLVRRFAYSDVVDTIELRGVLEGTVARFAAERGVPAPRMAEMRKILAQLDTCFGRDLDDVDFERYSAFNSAYHEALWRLPGSHTMMRELAKVTRLPFASPSAFLPSRRQPGLFRQSLREAQSQHRAIVEAIEAREGARAEALAREHARSARNNLALLFDEGGDLALGNPALALMEPGDSA
ncbi:GntR family transcriptional regulator [Amorphus sp. 3PC139-8]